MMEALSPLATRPVSATIATDDFRLSDWLKEYAQHSVKERSDTRALLLIIKQLLIYSAFFFAAISDSSIFLNIISSVCLGVVIAQAFVIGHDACHQSLARSGLLNKIIGRVAFSFSLHSYTLWHQEHNVNHHGNTNIKEKDSGWVPLTKDEFDQLPMPGQLLYRLYRSPFGAGVYYMIEIWLKKLLFPVTGPSLASLQKHIFDVFVILFAISCQLTLALVSGKYIAPEKSLFEIFVLGWLIPLLAWNWLMGVVVYLHHTHPQVKWYFDRERFSFAELQRNVTVRVIFPKFFNFVLYNIMEHTAHHVLPSIPWHDLPVAQKRLESASESDIVVFRWSLAEYLQITRTCKLYDYTAKQWLGFDGQPSG